MIPKAAFDFTGKERAEKSAKFSSSWRMLELILGLFNNQERINRGRKLHLPQPVQRVDWK